MRVYWMAFGLVVGGGILRSVLGHDEDGSGAVETLHNMYQDLFEKDGDEEE